MIINYSLQPSPIKKRDNCNYHSFMGDATRN
nr:MAG TPA: hypothetical protein [Crassvirales sp.]